MRQRLVQAALGGTDCDLLFRNTTFFDAFSLRWVRGDVAVFNGAIVGLEPGLKARREIDGRKKFLVPGFIDAHVHIESSLLTPAEFQKAVLPKGTTTAICDPHELANVQGLSGIRYFLKAATKSTLDLRVMLSSCVPATAFETNGGGFLSAAKLLTLKKHPKALGLAEMMNVPGVLSGDRRVWDKLKAFADRPVDGHCPLLRGKELSAYAASGISSCHESTQLDEAQEKLTKGLAVWIREGSVAKDLAALAPLLTEASSAVIGFCTDDRNPLDIAREGHVDHLVRGAIARGIPMEAVYRASAWSVARHYGLRTKGAIAPGYDADLVVLEDRESCAIESVWCKGQSVAELDLPSSQRQRFARSVKAKKPEARDLEGPKGRVHVIGVDSGTLLTSRSVRRHDEKGVARLTVLERHGKNRRPANAYVAGFGGTFRGAIASSVGHDSHNLIVVGSNTEDMAVALGALVDSQGGYAVALDKQVTSLLPLPFGGLMTSLDAGAVAKKLIEMRLVCKHQGCVLDEPFLQLAFLSLPVIPSLKLTDLGLFDVEKFQLIGVRAV
jgi:adenine deaminase